MSFRLVEAHSKKKIISIFGCDVFFFIIPSNLNSHVIKVWFCIIQFQTDSEKKKYRKSQSHAVEQHAPSKYAHRESEQERIKELHNKQTYH